MTSEVSTYLDHHPIRGGIFVALAIAAFIFAIIHLYSPFGWVKTNGWSGDAWFFGVSFFMLLVALISFHKIHISCDSNYFQIDDLPRLELQSYDFFVLADDPHDMTDQAIIFLNLETRIGVGFRTDKLNLSSDALDWILENLEKHIRRDYTYEHDLGKAMYYRDDSKFRIYNLHFENPDLHLTSA